MTDEGATPFRWAILGTGAVARKFTLDLAQLKGRAVPQVVASRTRANAEAFARDLGVTHVAKDYAAAAARADIDALYIATPPALHEAHARLGIDAGKAVLIEKPITLDAAAATRIATAAQAAGTFCMEAMWTRFQPLLSEIKSQVEAGSLGAVRGFDARFMAANKPNPNMSLFEPEQGGGALMHRGIYPLSLARFLLGPVETSQASSLWGETGVDEDTVLTLRHLSGGVSTLRSSLRTAGPDGAVIYGTKGTLYMTGPIWRPTGAYIRTTVPAGRPSAAPRRFEGFRESGMGLKLSGTLAKVHKMTGRGQTPIRAPFAGNGYHYEAQAVMQAVAEGRSEDPRMALEESIEIMRIIDAARTHRPAEGP